MLEKKGGGGQVYFRLFVKNKKVCYPLKLRTMLYVIVITLTGVLWLVYSHDPKDAKRQRASDCKPATARLGGLILAFRKRYALIFHL